jgi:hypothetical protein
MDIGGHDHASTHAHTHTHTHTHTLSPCSRMRTASSQPSVHVPHSCEQDTVNFSTEDASGSTSQAANTIEAIEAGSNCLLIDEDTCATNFMIRDRRMQMLVASHLEPITPFLYKVRSVILRNAQHPTLTVATPFSPSQICLVSARQRVSNNMCKCLQH